jgi:cytochrome c biogenesis protein CcdA
MPVMKFFLRFLVIYSAVFVLAYLIPEFIHRRDFDRAFVAWLHDPAPQNEAVLRNEQRKNEMIKLADTAVIALTFVTLGAGVYFIGRFVRHKVDGRRNGS